MGFTLTLSASGPALPILLVLPPCALLMLVLAGYVLAMREAEMPESRRRIRTAGSIVMMMTQPLIVYLFSVVTPATPRRFMLTWAILIGLLLMLVILAMVDVVNNVRLHSKMRSSLRSEFANIQRDVRTIVKNTDARESAEAKDTDLRLAGGEPDADRENES